MADWWARVPEYGVGLLPTQFHESPPAEYNCAPAGAASSTQTVVPAVEASGRLVEMPDGGVFVVVGVFVFVTGGAFVVFRARTLKNNRGLVEVTLPDQLKFPLASKELVAIEIQLVPGAVGLVESRMAYFPPGVPPVPDSCSFGGT